MEAPTKSCLKKIHSNPLKKVAAEPKAAATPKPEKAEVSPPAPKQDLTWATYEDFVNALIKNQDSEEALKKYALILGIEYNPNFGEFLNEAGAKFEEFRGN